MWMPRARATTPLSEKASQGFARLRKASQGFAAGTPSSPDALPRVLAAPLWPRARGGLRKGDDAATHSESLTSLTRQGCQELEMQQKTSHRREIQKMTCGQFQAQLCVKFIFQAGAVKLLESF